MLNRIVPTLFLACLFLMCAVLPARAQELCAANFEMVTSLFEPSFGSYSIWETVKGEGQRQEAFKSVADMGAGVTLAAGEMVPLAGVHPVVMLTAYDKRGQELWEKFHNVSSVEAVVKILKTGEDRIALMVNRNHRGEGKTVWIGFFDAQGMFKTQKVIREKGKQFVGMDMALSPDGKRLIIAVSEVKAGGTAEKPVITHSPEVHILDVSSGKTLVSRAYVMGADAEILGVSSALFGEEQGEAIFVTGYVSYDGQKKSGWVMRLGPDAMMEWQQPFSRGLQSRLKRSAIYMKEYILAAGDALPTDGGHAGGWLMLIEASSGRVMWQRFYTGGYDYSGVDLAVHEDGLIALMMQATAPEVKDPDAPKVPLMEDDGTIIGKMDYLHMLVVDPRGVTLTGESYFKGYGARGFQMVLSADRRYLIAGSAETPYAEIYQKFAGMNDQGAFSEPAEGADDAGMPDQAVLTKAGLPGAEVTIGTLPADSPMEKTSLSDASVPERSLSGLALLNKKVSESVESKEGAEAEAGDEADLPRTTLDGWVFAGNGPEEYKDPCVKPEAVLP
ncbi:MAG: hypothetical protein KDI90_10445 [Alphaproteobacteria bacterium]|nr:hypothetical protein [Alphaproteobacteria bacterium]MCB9975668.1 hypothetical protein [Rhodospirillales bacterium]